MGFHRWSFLGRQASPAFLLLTCVLLGVLLVAASQSNDDVPPPRLPRLKPFLQEFRQSSIPRVAPRDVEWPTAGGMQSGYLVRPLVEERLPTILLLSDKRGLHDWLRLSARELASVGYIVLAIDVTKLNGTASSVPRASTPSPDVRREHALNQLTAAVRWLHRQPGVDPERSGVVGLSAGAEWALAVAADQKLQACVTIDGPVSDDPVLLSGLRRTALLAICSGQHAQSLGQANIDVFHRALAARHIESEFLLFKQAEAGFLEPSRKAVYRFADADRAWVVLYEFLGTHVEDAPVKELLAADPPPVADVAKQQAGISDLMLAVNAPAGVRGRLLNLLSKHPADARVWRDVRARAAVMAETAKLLERLAPPQGPRTEWRKHVAAYRSAAAELLESADQQDFQSAQSAFERLNATCTACHRTHR